MMKIRDIIKVTGGRLLSGDPGTDIDPAKISTDSRTIRRGEYFLALGGRNHDGNRYVDDAFAKGAAGAIITRYAIPRTTHLVRVQGGRTTRDEHVVIMVKDGIKALQRIAAQHRSSFDIPVIAVTGSNGKTTVKDMIATVLSARYNVLKTDGTKNNHIGMPQTLLKLNRGHDICVIELGTNHPGEITALGKIASPTVAVITNIGPSHLEHLDDLEGVYSEKACILKTLDKDRGVAIVNGDDRYLSRIPRESFKAVTFGLDPSNDIYADRISDDGRRIRFSVNGRERFVIGLIGRHNVYNALSAIACGVLFGISYKEIRAAAAGFRPSGMRLDVSKVRGIDIIKDCYNSNPLSMSAAIKALVRYPASAKWVVAGDMMELGRKAAAFHKAAGQDIARSGIKGLVAIGSMSKHTISGARASGMSPDRSWHCSSHGEIAAILKRFVKRGDAVLLKGSRAMKIEKVLERL